MKKYILSLSTLFTLNLNAECVSPNQYFPFDTKWAAKDDRGEIILGMYARMSPDGRYVLRSFSGKGLTEVTLMELTKNAEGKNIVIPYNTPLKNEAFPVQGTWRYIVDISGDHYKFTDILKDQKRARKQFNGGIKGFYTVAAELSGGDLENHQIRSLSWPSNNPDNQGVGQLTNQIIKAKKNNDGSYSKIDSGPINYMCNNLKGADGAIMSLPMLSPNGIEFASMPQSPKDGDPSMRIFKFDSDNKSCTKVEDLKLAVAKIMFSYPENNMALFYSTGSVTNRGNGVSFYDRTSKKVFSLNDPNKKVFADSFPGFTKDGRIVYGAKWEECNDKGCFDQAGYVVSDPYQSPEITDFKSQFPNEAKHLKSCITTEEISELIKNQNKTYL